MMHLSAYGRLGADPRDIPTKTGTSMAGGNLAVELHDRQGEAHTQWIGVVTFGKVAETLLKHSKGDLLSVCGRVQFNTFVDGQGQTREQLQVVADSVISARSVRPGGRKKASQSQRDMLGSTDDFNDQIPF